MPSTSDSAPAPVRASVRTPARRVSVDPEGPVLVEGPVEIVLDDGTVARSDRFMVAVCTCRRSRAYPWCDTSHRRRERADSPPEDRNPL
ncbi:MULTISPECIES: CDGSH iron-sulfur domain-containing protein [unclassified Streptomyces]|uniref:CDGSH iron-sulfur domain-containing protein n=1 Tax=unclassified Streptomyces TaxID=2593676 RepID=UPI00225295A8|nr:MULTISPECIES: CDGSH iron-sulfur domain-containing protein [unclassified Streptomyces]MCX4633509.1 CDGSH iron-sulfur domain-containing protein [Streptomyces sp. NBC_01443]WSW49740.1 CDGSH iron-sulfur domain-containing protein [Streptomyces sp. NBC_01001]